MTNSDIVRAGYLRFIETGEFDEDLIADDFVWDMTTFRGWPERQLYEGVEGAREFMSEWLGAFDEWALEIESIRETGDHVVVVARQRGRSRSTGLPVDMRFAQIFTLRDGKQVRMRMYADPAEAFGAAGIPRPEGT